ncbi:ABC transporter substrate-binding protein [Kerstersia similis]|uniref:ABC transporter substrate-binding protein n=1 Tax=Kerstersia similis TaxID=206505 RepID=UPI0039EF6B4B
MNAWSLFDAVRWPQFRTRLPVAGWRRGTVALVLGWALGSSAAVAGPVQGGTLTWSVFPEPSSSLVPLTTTEHGNQRIGPKIVEGLLTYDFDLKPLPQLATGWAVSPDGLRYTFDLREGVKWHDGKDFTAEDVAFSIDALRQFHPRGRTTFGSVTEIQTPTPHQVVLILSKPAPYLLTALAASESPIVPKHLYAGTEVATNPANQAPVGTGPFRFKEWVKGSHIVLERNPDYWDTPRPYLDRIVVRAIPDAAARAAALESGEVLLGGDRPIPLSDIARFQAIDGLQVDTRHWPYAGTHLQMYFNFDRPVLQDRRVRQAIAATLDLDAFQRLIWYGYGQPSASPIGKLLTAFHDDSIKPVPYDVAEANRLLDAAGYPKDAKGVRLKLKLLITPFQDPRAAGFVRQSLARAGIDATVVTNDFAAYARQVYTDRDFDLTLESLANVFDPTIGVQRVFWSKNFQAGVPFTHTPHYQNPAVDAALEAAAVEPDPARRREFFRQFQQLVSEDVASIELGAPPNITVASQRVKDYAVTGEGIAGNFAHVYLERE